MSVYISGQSGTLVLLVRWCSIEWCDSPSRCECTQECTGGQRPSTQRPCHRVLLLSAVAVTTAAAAAAAAVICCLMLLGEMLTTILSARLSQLVANQQICSKSITSERVC